MVQNNISQTQLIRSDIDGLRAIAIASVILYHLSFHNPESQFFKSGFLGVDVFFVVSGFLITNSIKRNYQSCSFSNYILFAKRRIVRLVPSLVVVSSLTILIGFLFFEPNLLKQISKTQISSSFFLSNYFLYHSSTFYGSLSSFYNPLLHTWSLGIEMQFYLILAPFIMLLVEKFSRRSAARIVILFVICFFIQNLLLVESYVSFSFYSLNTRLFELGIGVACALLTPERNDHKAPLQDLGFLTILCCFFFYDSTLAHPGFFAGIVCLGSALILTKPQKNYFSYRFLTLSPMILVGKLSYSLYLVHFPVFSISYVLFGNLSQFGQIGMLVAVFFLALILHKFVELPAIKTGWNPRRKFFFVTPIGAILCLAASISIYVSEGMANRFPDQYQKFFSDMGFNGHSIDGVRCFERADDFCTADLEAEATDVYFLGDSQFASISRQLIEALADKFNYRESHMGNCPFILNVFDVARPEKCNLEYQSKRYDFIEKKPSVVVLGGRYSLYLKKNGLVENKAEIYDEEGPNFYSVGGGEVADKFRETIDRLVEDGHSVILFYPIPETVSEFRNKVLRSYIFEEGNLSKLGRSFNDYQRENKEVFELFDSVDGESIFRIRPADVLCKKDGRCEVAIGGEILYFDSAHLSAQGGMILKPIVRDAINQATSRILD